MVYIFNYLHFYQERHEYIQYFLAFQHDHNMSDISSQSQPGLSKATPKLLLLSSRHYDIIISINNVPNPREKKTINKNNK